MLYMKQEHKKVCSLLRRVATREADLCYYFQMTIPPLKAWLQGKNMSVSGKKADLLERVEEYFEQK